jgi:hypothetical protein
MSQNIFSICNIVATDSEDYQFLIQHLGNYPVKIDREFPSSECFDEPTILIGWNIIKDKYPNQNIFDKKIQDNLYWTYSHSEDKKKFLQEVEEFFYNQIKKWLPSEFLQYDSLFSDLNFFEFCENNLNKDLSVFVYFHNGALYVRNDNKNYVINIKSLYLTESEFKKAITRFINSYKVIAFSYKNFCDYIDLDTIGEIMTIENLRWVNMGVDTSDKYFNIIPNFDTHKYIPFFMSKLNSIYLDAEEQGFMKRMCKRDIATFWMSTRELSFSESFSSDRLDFKIRKGYKLSKIEYSDKRTITGRVTAHDNYNPQNLQKDNQERADIITRFEGGSILVYDYTSFETRISLFKCKNEEYRNKYKDADLHYETAKILYQKFDITDQERDFSKTLNHAILYGAGEETLLKRMANFSEPEYKLYLVKSFLSPLIEMANEMRDQYSNRGYLVNDWGSIVRIEKTHASFNNYIQSTASEIIVDKVLEVRELLKGKNSQFLFQVHDSMVFDIHPSEKYLINEIGKLLSIHNDMHFTLAYKVGSDYKNLSENINYSH